MLIDVTSDSPQFAALAGLVRRGGTAVTIRFVADQQALARAGVTDVKLRCSHVRPLLDRMATAVTAGTVEPPPITKLGPGDVPGRLSGPRHREGTTVIVM